MEKTLKLAILKSLERFDKTASAQDIYEHIIANESYDFGESKTPVGSVTSVLGDFIRYNDTRVGRTKVGKVFYYYLTKKEQLAIFEVGTEAEIKTPNVKSYRERDLHLLLSTYLYQENVYSKTVFHEKSNTSDEQQKWIHPDMLGVHFLDLKTDTTKKLFSKVSIQDTFKLISYEVKREVNSDYELKKSFFQAVSNSSWANEGYLVAFEFSDKLKEEMKRLNQSFGIGFIQLKANPFESLVLFQSQYRKLDFKTIDKLCHVNDNFNDFIKETENLMSVEERNRSAVETDFIKRVCDGYYTDDEEIKNYCKKKNIPIEDNE